MTDEKLIAQYKNGNMRAFNLLVERWQQRVFRFAYHYFGSYDEAMEITQKTFIRAHKKIHTLNHSDKFSSWIYRIANNLCLDESKRAGRRWSTSLEAVAFHPVIQDADTHPGRFVQQKELKLLLQRALNQLPPPQRTVVIMKEYEGLKFREIAEILAIPESTVKTRMYSGLKTLKKLFEQWNIEPEVINYE